MKYEYIIVENFKPKFPENSHFELRVRPAFDQGEFKMNMRVECPKEMRDKKQYPPGTKFKIKAKITDRDGTKFIYTHYTWPFEVVE